MNAYKQEFTTLGIASAGVYATIGDNVSVNIPDNRLAPYFGDLAENGIVIDKRPCVERDDFAHMVVSGPMFKESLPEKTVLGWDRIPKPCNDWRDAKSFDYISIDVYLDMWRNVGAKIGRRVGNTIVWECGQVSDIPSVENRWQ